VTNIVLNLVVIALVVGVSWRVLRRLRPSALVWTTVLLLVLTLVFDTLMIAVGLYVYHPDRILGVYVWGAPLEDFAYPLVAALGVPALWEVLGRRRPADGEGTS
jgi:lycopene cyclase domain-containing protein